MLCPERAVGGALFSGEPSKGLIGEAEVAQTRAEPSPMTCFSPSRASGELSSPSLKTRA